MDPTMMATRLGGIIGGEARSTNDQRPAAISRYITPFLHARHDGTSKHGGNGHRNPAQRSKHRRQHHDQYVLAPP